MRRLGDAHSIWLHCSHREHAFLLHSDFHGAAVPHHGGQAPAQVNKSVECAALQQNHNNLVRHFGLVASRAPIAKIASQIARPPKLRIACVAPRQLLLLRARRAGAYRVTARNVRTPPFPKRLLCRRVSAAHHCLFVASSTRRNRRLNGRSRGRSPDRASLSIRVEPWPWASSLSGP